MSDPYPKVPKKAWAALRSKVASAPTTKLTPSVVAATMGMSSAGSARSNIVAPLEKMGLIDGDGALTDLGNKWRNDDSYSDACDGILQSGLWPDDLQSLTGPDGQPDLAALRTWFAQDGFGESNARQMASTYAMIAERRPPEEVEVAPKKKPAEKATKQTSPSKSAPPPKAPATASMVANGTQAASGGPKLHLDIQIHIPATATPEQIDQIFASMAKHLY